MNIDEVLEQIEELVVRAHELGVDKVEVEDIVEGVFER